MLVVVNIEEGDGAYYLPREIFSRLMHDFEEVDFHWNKRKADYFKEVAKAEVIWGWSLSREVFELAEKLKWFHAQAVGVRKSIFPELKDSKIVFTNSRGVPSVAISEHTIALILAALRKIPLLILSKEQKKWAQEEIVAKWKEMKEVADCTFGVFGLGTIGERIARLLKAFGGRVYGYRAREKPCEYVEKVFLGEDIWDMLGECDFVINTLPATEETFHFFDERKFSTMKEGAYFINVGRGYTVDEHALMRALGYDEKKGKWREGWLSGAALDVFADEPLPRDCPLWEAPNVIISPHVSSVSPSYWNKAYALFKENLQRYLRGDELINVVDLHRGY